MTLFRCYRNWMGPTTQTLCPIHSWMDHCWGCDNDDRHSTDYPMGQPFSDCDRFHCFWPSYDSVHSLCVCWESFVELLVGSTQPELNVLIVAGCHCNKLANDDVSANSHAMKWRMLIHSTCDDDGDAVTLTIDDLIPNHRKMSNWTVCASLLNPANQSFKTSWESGSNICDKAISNLRVPMFGCQHYVNALLSNWTIRLVEIDPKMIQCDAA